MTINKSSTYVIMILTMVKDLPREIIKNNQEISRGKGTISKKHQDLGVVKIQINNFI